jgi:hypothetical protein
MWMPVMLVATSASVTIHAATAIAQVSRHKRRRMDIQAREADLLPVPYFHVVFTLPDAVQSTGLSSAQGGV